MEVKLTVGPYVGRRSVRRPFYHYFLKGWKVSPPCFYQSTGFLPIVFWDNYFFLLGGVIPYQASPRHKEGMEDYARGIHLLLLSRSHSPFPLFSYSFQTSDFFLREASSTVYFVRTTVRTSVCSNTFLSIGILHCKRENCKENYI